MAPSHSLAVWPDQMCLVARVVFSERFEKTRSRVLQVRDTTPCCVERSQWLNSKILQKQAPLSSLCDVLRQLCASPTPTVPPVGVFLVAKPVPRNHGVAKPRLCHVYPTRRIPAVKSLLSGSGFRYFLGPTSVQPSVSTPNRISHYCLILA